MVYVTPGLLGPAGIHLSQWGRSIFCPRVRLGALFERALN